MTPKKVLLLEPQGSPWARFLTDYFSDVPAVLEFAHEPAQAACYFDKTFPSILFLSAAFLTKPMLSKIQVRKVTDPRFRTYFLGKSFPEENRPYFDGFFSAIPEPSFFGRRFVERLPLPEAARILVVDDEREIGAMVSDYFGGRKEPRFEVLQAADGREALAAIARQRPAVIVLDIKMPGMDGREFYAKLKAQEPDIPVIVFFDSISSEELAEIRKYGNPAVVEKGFQGSSLDALLQLVKKLIYFSSETRD